MVLEARVGWCVKQEWGAQIMRGVMVETCNAGCVQRSEGRSVARGVRAILDNGGVEGCSPESADRSVAVAAKRSPGARGKRAAGH